MTGPAPRPSVASPLVPSGRSLRLALLSEYPVPGRPSRGAMENNAFHLVEGLRAHSGVEIGVVTCRTGRLKDTVHLNERLTLYNVPLSRRFPMMTLFARETGAAAELLRQASPAVVHAQGAEIYGYMASRVGWPWVMTIHGIRQYEARHHQGMARVQLLLQSLLQLYCVRRARHIICISPYVRGWLRGRTKATLHDIEIPIDPHWWELQRQPQRGRILFVGALTPLKRPLDLVRAFERVAQNIPEATLRLAGGVHVGDREAAAYVDQIQAYIGSRQLGDRVHLLGFIDHDHLSREMEQAGVLALPSGQETAPIAIAEAMAAGLPVVATGVGGVPYLVDDSVTGKVVAPGDIESLSNALTEVLADPDRATRMGSLAREIAASRFRPDVVAPRTLEVYRQVIDSWRR